MPTPSLDAPLPPVPAGFSIRDATEADCAAIAAIGAHFARETLVTWSDGATESPTEASVLARLREARAQPAGSLAAFPWLALVEDAGGAVAGFAYASAFRARLGWRFTCEDSISVRPGLERRGLGRALLARLVARCRAAGLRLVVAAISVDGERGARHAAGDALGAGSEALHASLGFRRAGLLRRAGEKFGRVMDCLFMELDLEADEGAAEGAAGADAAPR
jgi:L-amino acid N-acyltransferase YncA